MRWSEDVTLRFVELYREHECLWYISIPEYRDKWLKQMAYEHMVQEMGLK